MGLARSRWQYVAHRREYEVLRARPRLRELAALHPRRGYEQMHVLLCQAGSQVNYKLVLRLYREKGPIAGRKPAEFAAGCATWRVPQQDPSPQRLTA